MKAEIVAERKNVFFSTVEKQFPVPSVIKLCNYIKIPFKSVELSRKNIIKRDNNKCQYCGKKSLGMTIDHIIPKSRGGDDTWENLITACLRCNNRKGNRTPDEAGMPLLSKPRKPNHITFLRQQIGLLDDSWKPFLFID
jgi:5-methylcytosine-specific restriction endonuclease McrA